MAEAVATRPAEAPTQGASFRRHTTGLIRDASKILVTGYERWATVGSLFLAVATVVSKTASGVIESGFAWLGVIPLCGVAVYSLLRAHHNEVVAITAEIDTRDAAAAELEARVADLKEQVANLKEIVPVVSFRDPEHEDAQPMVDGRTQSFVFGCVANSQRRPGHGEVAKDAYPMLTFEGLGGGTILGPIKGRWRDAPSPLMDLSPTQHHTHLETIDLRPNDEPRQFDIATKPLELLRCYAIDSKQVAHEIPIDGGDIRVRVVIRGSNFPDVEESLVLQNPGYGGALRAWRENP